MLQELAALTPPLVVCVAFLIGLAMLLRREMSPKRRAERDTRRRSRRRGLDISGNDGFIRTVELREPAERLAARSAYPRSA
jgi:hypothetical protein